jgi:hypothetical protein
MFLDSKFYLLTYFETKTHKKYPKNLNKLISQLKILLNWSKKHKIKRKKNSLSSSIYFCKARRRQKTTTIKLLSSNITIRCQVLLFWLPKSWQPITFRRVSFFSLKFRDYKMNKANFWIKMKIIMNLRLAMHFLCILQLSIRSFDLVFILPSMHT